MGNIKKKVTIKGLADKVVEVTALFDTAADLGVISQEIINEINPFKFGKTMAKGLFHEAKERDIYTFGVQIDDCSSPIRAVLEEKGDIKSIDEEIDIIIGHETMQEIGDVKIDMENKQVICKVRTRIV